MPGKGWELLDTLPEGVDPQLWQQASDMAHRARIYLSQGDLAQAREYCEKALDLFEQIGDSRETLVCVGTLGDIAFWSGDPLQAIDLYEEAAQRARRLKDGYLEAFSLLKAGSIYGLLGDQEIAGAYRERASRISDRAVNDLDTPSGEEILDFLERIPEESPFSRLKEFFKKQSSGTSSVQQSSSAEKADSNPRPDRLSGEAVLPVSDELVRIADEMAQLSSQDTTQMVALAIKGESYRSQGQMLAAKEQYLQALQHAEALDESELADYRDNIILVAHQGLAEVLLVVGSPGLAIDHLRQALTIQGGKALITRDRDMPQRIQAWESEKLLARMYELMGKAQMSLGQVEEAGASLQQAVDICISWQDLPMPRHIFVESLRGTGICLLEQAVLYVQLERPNLALEKLTLALSAFEHAEDRTGMARVHLEMANALEQLLFWPSLFGSEPSLDRATLVTDLESHFEAARELYRQEGNRKGEADIAGTTARYLLRRGLLGQAEAWLKEARQLHDLEGDVQGLVVDYLNLGGVYSRLELPDLAEESFQEALRLVSQYGLSTWKAQAELGLLREAQQKPEAAYDYLQASVQNIEYLRTQLKTGRYKEMFFEDKEIVYQHLVRLCQQLGRDQEAYLTVERSKSRAFLDLLSHTTFAAPEHVDSALVKREAELIERIRFLSNDLDSASGERQIALLQQIRDVGGTLDSLLDDIARVAPEYVDLRRGQPSSYEELRRLLGV